MKSSTTTKVKKVVQEMGHQFTRTYSDRLRSDLLSIKFVHTVINDELTLRRLIEAEGLQYCGLKFIPPKYHGHFWGTRVYVYEYQMPC